MTVYAFNHQQLHAALDQAARDGMCNLPVVEAFLLSPAAAKLRVTPMEHQRANEERE